MYTIIEYKKFTQLNFRFYYSVYNKDIYKSLYICKLYKQYVLYKLCKHINSMIKVVEKFCTCTLYLQHSKVI